MSKAYKGTMGIAYPFEGVNRKLAPRSVKAGSATVVKEGSDNGRVYMPNNTLIVGFQRKYGVITGNGEMTTVKPQYFCVRANGRSTVVTNDELAARQMFASISKAASSLMKNLEYIQSIQELFLGSYADNSKKVNGVSVRGYSNVRQWVFAVQMAGKKADPNYNINQFPQQFDA